GRSRSTPDSPEQKIDATVPDFLRVGRRGETGPLNRPAERNQCDSKVTPSPPAPLPRLGEGRNEPGAAAGSPLPALGEGRGVRACLLNRPAERMRMEWFAARLVEPIIVCKKRRISRRSDFMSIQLRPFREEDYPRYVEIGNRVYPENRGSVEEARH